jgi:hypothetical protein
MACKILPEVVVEQGRGLPATAAKAPTGGSAFTRSRLKPNRQLGTEQGSDPPGFRRQNQEKGNGAAHLQ